MLRRKGKAAKLPTRSQATGSFIDARLQRHGKDPDSAIYKNATRRMWQAAMDAVLVAGRENHIDAEIAGWISHTVNEILANRQPSEIKAIRKRGGIRDTHAITEAKHTAALYRQAVSAKAIEDKSPIKTLRKAFCCAEQTIHDWIQQAPKGLWKKFRPNDEPAIRKKYLLIRLKHDAKLMRVKSQTAKSLSSRR